MERDRGRRRVLVRKANGKRVARPKLCSAYLPRREKQSSRSALSSVVGGIYGKCAEPSKMPGVGFARGTRRTRRSGTCSQWCRVPGNRKVAGSIVQRFPRFLRFDGT